MNWQAKKLEEICEIYQPQTITSKDILKEGPYKVFGANGIIGYYHKFNHELSEVLITCRGATCGTINFSEPKSWITGNAMVVHPRTKDINKSFLFYFLKASNLKRTITGSAQPQITRLSLAPFQINIPPIKVQQQIVEKLDAIRKLQELNNKKIEKTEELFDSFITSQLFSKNNSKTYRFDDISTSQYGLTAEGKDKGEYRFIRITDIDETGQLRSIGRKYVEADRKQVEKYLLKDGDLLVARTGATYGKFVYCEPQEPSVFASYLIKLAFKPELVLPRFVWLFTRTERYWVQARKLVTGSGQPQFNANRIKEIAIPLPPLNRQKEIVAKAEQLLIYSNGLGREQIILKELFQSTLNKLMKPN